MMSRLEVCVDSVESALAAQEGGADRLEVCANLIIGGTTPGVSQFRQIRKACEIELNVLIRPRFGDFLYTEAEFRMMQEDIRMFRELGADGVVAGCLKADGRLDGKRIEELRKCAGDLTFTLHRAFDVCRDPYEALEEAVCLGIDTILTSGQASACTKGAEVLKKLVAQAEERIEILVGGGVNAEVIRRIRETAKASSFHMSGKKVTDSGMTYRKQGVHMGLLGLSEYDILRTDKEEIEKSSHAYFDEQNRLLYALGYSANILSGKNNYCEENIYQRNNTEHTCRYIYYKSNSAPYRDGYYIAYRYMFEASDFQFDEQDRLLLHLSYRRNVGSDPNGYSEELFFSEGYQAEYDKERLMAEWCYRDYWGTNEVGVWEYRIYQYNKQGDCSLKVVVTEEEILLLHYKYLKESGQAEVYAYQVTEDFEISCEDGSTYYLRPQWGKPALQKVAADGRIEKELFYGKAIDMGQQHYLMPKEVEETLDDHIYTVHPGDCLWNIAKQHYGYGSYYTLLYRMNRGTIGDDNYLLLPGMRLYIPEVGNAQDTKVTD